MIFHQDPRLRVELEVEVLGSAAVVGPVADAAEFGCVCMCVSLCVCVDADLHLCMLLHCCSLLKKRTFARLHIRTCARGWSHEHRHKHTRDITPPVATVALCHAGHDADAGVDGDACCFHRRHGLPGKHGGERSQPMLVCAYVGMWVCVCGSVCTAVVGWLKPWWGHVPA